LAGLPLIMPTLSHGSRKYMDLAAAKTGVRWTCSMNGTTWR